jgi:hypothetical protein
MQESLDTTMARAHRESAKEAWEGHRDACAECGSHGRNRELCRRGGILKTNLGRMEAELRRQRELDAQPNPNQGTLI